MKLIIAEKPSVARDIAGALDDTFSKHNGYLKGKKIAVSWSIGHLVSLANPEDYRKEWKSWKKDSLPIMPEKFKLAKGKHANEQLAILKKLLNEEAITSIVNACDAGREGELIFDYVYRFSKCKKPVERMWLSSMTKVAIKNAIKKLKPSEEYDGLRAAANCRSQADWLVGINATRAASIKSNIEGVVSLGRVQTPTLAILAKRENELINFVPEDYWVVGALFKANLGEYKGIYENSKKLTEEKATEIVAAVKGKPGVTKVTAKDFSEPAPLLYDLTTIQREASSKFGFTAELTLSTLQMLYEIEKVITYPRTNSRYLSSDMEASLPELLEQLSEDYPGLVENAKLSNQKIIDDSKVTDHHAIIITNKKAEHLNGDFAKLYDLIARRFISVFYPPALGSNKTIVTKVEEHDFYSKGKAYSDLGWRAVYVKDASKLDKTLPDVKDGETVETLEVESLKKQTKPPKRYSDGTLLGAMESAGKDIDDAALRESMKENGLGTPATRASIIERLLTVGYITRDSKNFTTTEKGLYVINWLDDHPLVSAELTGKWESKLLEMEENAAIAEPFMQATNKMVIATVEGIFGKQPPPPPDSIKPKPRADRESVGKCPNCDKSVYENKKAISCWAVDDPGCGLAIWKTMAGRKLTKKTIKQLLETGQADTVDGFKSRAGNEFSAKLKIVKKDGKPQVRFDEDWANRPPKPADRINYL